MLTEIAVASMMAAGLSGPIAAGPAPSSVPTATQYPVPQGTTYWDFWGIRSSPLTLKRSGNKYWLAWAFDAVWCQKGTIGKSKATKFRYLAYEEVGEVGRGTGAGKIWIAGGRLNIWDADTNLIRKYRALPKTAEVKKGGAEALDRCAHEMR